VPIPGLVGLYWAVWFETHLALQDAPPDAQGSGESTNGAGLFSLHVIPGISTGQEIWIEVSDYPQADHEPNVAAGPLRVH